MFQRIVAFVRDLYGEPEEFIPLHAPRFAGNEKRYLDDCIDSTFVSSVGRYVDRFEESIRDFTGAGRAVAVVNGTAALNAALALVGVEHGDLVLTQGVSFVATANAIRHAGADPVFLDVDEDTLGLSPGALRRFLETHARREGGRALQRESGRRLAACVPVHIFGHGCRIEEIAAICREWGIELVEDAAEALGGFRQGRHLGTFARLGTLSFNGNKTITTGGGGMLLTNDLELGARAKHLTTTAKVPHPYAFFHDETAWNFRLPNLNAALGCAQMEQLADILADKRAVAAAYKAFFADMPGLRFVDEPAGCRSNFWLNAVLLEDRRCRDELLEYANAWGVMCRPLWTPLPDLPMYSGCYTDGVAAGRGLADRLVNLPSGPRRAAHAPAL